MDACAGRETRRCHDMAMTVADMIITLAREKAKEGAVALSDIERIANLVGGGTMLLDGAYAKQEEACRKVLMQPKGNIGARSNPFQRLMVRPFEHLLAGQEAVFQRGYLNNYFEFLEFAFEKRLEPFERHCRSIIQALKVVHGNGLTWDHFYADPRTIKTLHGALKLLVAYLSDHEGQRVWHACLIRPTPEMPQPAIGQIDQIRTALLETARGLAAAE
jgi:hypothetical protein